MDKIKDAFSKVKEDIAVLQEAIMLMTRQLKIIKQTINKQTDKQTDTQTHRTLIQTDRQINPTINTSPTDNLPLYGLKSPISYVSTGNEGVPTDRQTDQQTDQQTKTSSKIYLEPDFNSIQTDRPTNKLSELPNVSNLLNSLDLIKSDLKKKFTSLTVQEMLVFTTIYQLEEEGKIVDYTLLAQKLHLSESSMRDYVLKLSKKGLPLIKNKPDNKRVLLSIASDFKKIVSFQTLLAFKEL